MPGPRASLKPPPLLDVQSDSLPTNSIKRGPEPRPAGPRLPVLPGHRVSRPAPAAGAAGMRATTTLLICGLLAGYFLGRRRPLRLDVYFETEELATPSIFRRTTRLHYRPFSPVFKRGRSGPCLNHRLSTAGSPHLAVPQGVPSETIRQVSSPGNSRLNLLQAS